MEVTVDNFDDSLNLFCELLKSASFCAIDLEMTGITKPGLELQLTDTINERYQIMREVSSTFNIVQIGLCLAHLGDNGIVLSPFNIYVFPHSIGDRGDLVVLNTKSIEFLTQNHLNFERWITKGIPFINQDRMPFLQDEIDKRREYDQSFLESYLQRIKAADEGVSQPVRTKQMPRHGMPRAQRHATSGVGIRQLKNKADQQHADSILASIEAWYQLHIVQLATSTTHFTYTFSVPNSHIFRYIRDRINLESYETKTPSIMCIQRLEYHQQTGSASFKIFSKQHYERYLEDQERCRQIYKNQRMGAKLFFDELVDAKIPIIGHNCIYDLLFLYASFYKMLPPTYNEFRLEITRVFPYAYDTKYLFTHPSIAQLPGYKPTLSTTSTVLASLFDVLHNHPSIYPRPSYHLRRNFYMYPLTEPYFAQAQAAANAHPLHPRAPSVMGSDSMTWGNKPPPPPPPPMMTYSLALSRTSSSRSTQSITPFVRETASRTVPDDLATAPIPDAGPVIAINGQDDSDTFSSFASPQTPMSSAFSGYHSVLPSEAIPAPSAELFATSTALSSETSAVLGDRHSTMPLHTLSSTSRPFHPMASTTTTAPPPLPSPASAMTSHAHPRPPNQAQLTTIPSTPITSHTSSQFNPNSSSQVPPSRPGTANTAYAQHPSASTAATSTHGGDYSGYMAPHNRPQYYAHSISNASYSYVYHYNQMEQQPSQQQQQHHQPNGAHRSQHGHFHSSQSQQNPAHIQPSGPNIFSFTHEAGNDSLMTAVIFIHLLSMLLYQPPATSTSQCEVEIIASSTQNSLKPRPPTPSSSSSQALSSSSVVASSYDFASALCSPQLIQFRHHIYSLYSYFHFNLNPPGSPAMTHHHPLPKGKMSPYSRHRPVSIDGYVLPRPGCVFIILGKSSSNVVTEEFIRQKVFIYAKYPNITYIRPNCFIVDFPPWVLQNIKEYRRNPQMYEIMRIEDYYFRERQLYLAQCTHGSDATEHTSPRLNAQITLETTRYSVEQDDVSGEETEGDSDSHGDDDDDDDDDDRDDSESSSDGNYSPSYYGTHTSSPRSVYDIDRLDTPDPSPRERDNNGGPPEPVLRKRKSDPDYDHVRSSSTLFQTASIAIGGDDDDDDESTLGGDHPQHNHAQNSRQPFSHSDSDLYENEKKSNPHSQLDDDDHDDDDDDDTDDEDDDDDIDDADDDDEIDQDEDDYIDDDDVDEDDDYFMHSSPYILSQDPIQRGTRARRPKARLTAGHSDMAHSTGYYDDDNTLEMDDESFPYFLRFGGFGEYYTRLSLFSTALREDATSMYRNSFIFRNQTTTTTSPAATPPSSPGPGPGGELKTKKKTRASGSPDDKSVSTPPIGPSGSKIRRPLHLVYTSIIIILLGCILWLLNSSNVSSNQLFPPPI